MPCFHHPVCVVCLLTPRFIFTGAVEGNDEEDEFMKENVGDETAGEKGGMVETQMVRLVVRLFPITHKKFKGLGRVISLVGLPGVNVAKCLQRVCDPRFYDAKHGDIGRSREALWRELMHSEFGVMEGQMRHDDMEGRLCDFDSFDDRRLHIFHFCSEVNTHSYFSLWPTIHSCTPPTYDGRELCSNHRISLAGEYHAQDAEPRRAPPYGSRSRRYQGATVRPHSRFGEPS